MPIKAFSASRLLALARWNSARAGVISARDMGGAFTWMRPDDLVWKSWVNNYLMGDKPPAFDILAWNADGTNLPAALHAQFLDIFEHNPLATPGALTCLGTPVDLRTITVPTYVTGGVTDHLTPWTSLLPHDAAARRAEHLRAQQRRAHPEPGQPARQPEGQLLHRQPSRAA